MPSAAAVRLVLVVLAIGALVSACAGRPPSEPGLQTVRPATTLPPAATLAPGSTPLPPLSGCGGGSAPGPVTVATPGPDGLFTPLADFPADNAFEISSVTWSDNGFVAVGFGSLSGEDRFGQRQGLIWTSCDGLVWQKIVDPAFQYVSPLTVLALGPDLYVFGDLSTCDEDFEEECQDVAEAGNVILRSTAGGPWQRLALPADLQAAYLEGAAVINGRIAAYGDMDFIPTLWLSSDGSTWTSSTDLAAMEPITAMTAHGDGMLAFGTEYSDELEDTELVAATSTDGARFQQVDAPPLLGGTVDAVTAGPAGYVAVGAGYPEDSELALKAIALFSADGTTWIETDASDGSFEGSSLDGVHPLTAGYVALGFAIDDIDFTIQSGHAWLSADGRTWRVAGDFGTPTTAFATSALGPNGLIVFTADQEETEDGELISTIGAFFAPVDRLAP